MKQQFRKLAQSLICLAAIAVLLSGCATGPALVSHSFEFDTVGESPEVYVLDYQYGNSRQPTAKNPDYLRQEGRSLQSAGIGGPMLAGDFLYVKWRIRSTGEVLEDKVDLRKRLPADITNHTVHFVIDGRQLYVLLISDKERIEGLCPTGIKPGAEHRAFRSALSPLERAKYKYCYLKIITLYPDQPKP